MKKRQVAGGQQITPPDAIRKHNSLNGESLWRKLLRALLITVLAFLLSLLFTQPFSFSAGTMLSGTDKSDFNLTDFYQLVAEARPIRSLDTDIVIVDIADAGREEIADILNVISDMEPAAVGIDVVFSEERPGDDYLIEALNRVPNLVMAVGVGEKPGEKDVFMVDEYSYFNPTENLGVVNFPTKFSGSTIRSFHPNFICASGDTLPSFVLALAKLTNPKSVEKLRANNNGNVMVDFPSRAFTTLDFDEVPDNVDKIAGKIVLIGSLAEKEDVHATPINQAMHGVLIHAYALSTILRSATYKVVDQAVNMLIAFFLCFLLCYSNIAYTSPARAMWMRLIQLVVLYLIIRIGYYLFVDKQVVIDFSYSLMMLTFGFFALDIWNGLAYYVETLPGKIKKFVSKFRTHK